MYACAELLCVLTNVSNNFVFRRYPLRGDLAPSAAPACAPGELHSEFEDLQGVKKCKTHPTQIYPDIG